MTAFPYRTVVDSAATSRALVDASTVFDELGITAPTAAQSNQMETVIAQVSGLVDRFLDRVLAEEDVTDHFRDASGDALRLSRFPVAEVLEVIESGVALSSDAWELDEATGRLWRLNGDDRYSWASPGATRVSYVGGYVLPTDLPADIQRAAVDQIKAQFMSGARDPALRSFSVPDVYQATYSVAGGDSFGKSGLLAQVEAALAPHRRVSV
jgi:hypothetical protein